MTPTLTLCAMAAGAAASEQAAMARKIFIGGADQALSAPASAVVAREATVSADDCCRQRCVAGSGSATRRPYGHAGHARRTPPAPSDDVQYGRGVGRRRAVDSLENTWRPAGRTHRVGNQVHVR